MTAVWRRKPHAGAFCQSDQDRQYGSDYWRGFYGANRLLLSMTHRGDCWYYAVA